MDRQKEMDNSSAIRDFTFFIINLVKRVVLTLSSGGATKRAEENRDLPKKLDMAGL
jgi:hypothetical protein